MRWRGLAQPRGTVPPISQRPLRRSTTYQGQERSQCSGRPDHRVARGAPRAGGSGFPLCQRAGVSPKPGGAKYFPHRWLRAFFHQMTGVSPGQKDQFSLRRMAKSFLLITRLGVSPPPHNLKFSLRRWPRAFFSAHDSGFPLRHKPRSLPYAARPRSPLAGSPLARWHRAFPRDQRSQSLPNTGWPGVSPAPVARSFLLTCGAGLLLARKPGVVLCRVARGFPFAGYRPWW